MKCSNSNISLTKIANLEKNPKKLHALPVTFCLVGFTKNFHHQVKKVLKLKKIEQLSQ